METKHSPLPWKSTAWERGGEQVHDECAIHDANGEWVGDTVIDHDSSTATSATPHANAAFIVRAVNSHEDLLAACKALVALVGDCLCDELNPCWRHGQAAGTHWGGGKSCVACTARAAIAKVEGQDGAA